MIEVLTSFEVKPGTIVKQAVQSMEDIVVRGVAVDKNQAKVTAQTVPDQPGAAAALFQRVAEANINVDMIVQNVSREDGATDLTFTVARDDVGRVRQLLGDDKVIYDEEVAKVSAVGIGMRSHTGVAHRMFRALAAHDINIEMISTSEIKISVVVTTGDADKAVRALHTAFGLDEGPA